MRTIPPAGPLTSALNKAFPNDIFDGGNTVMTVCCAGAAVLRVLPMHSLTTGACMRVCALRPPRVSYFVRRALCLPAVGRTRLDRSAGLARWPPGWDMGLGQPRICRLGMCLPSGRQSRARPRYYASFDAPLTFLSSVLNRCNGCACVFYPLVCNNMSSLVEGVFFLLISVEYG